METARLILDYLQVILSGPVVLGTVVLIFTRMFRNQIGGVIERTWQIKFPGGELSASQQERSRELTPHTTEAQLPGTDVKLPDTINLNPEQAGKIVQLIQSERANAYLWEYRYLNFYLVRSTQMVLEWLASQPQPVSLRFLDSFLQPSIADANERGAIVSALQKHHLIVISGDAITVTPKGREYLQWRGPLPPAGAV